MTKPQPDAPRSLRIRKYPNRRFYDATRSRHVTLEEIHTLIRDGYDVEITDSKSGEDLTGRILAQIILELDAPKLSVFPVALLHRLIRANEQLVQDFLDKYFNRAFIAFQESQRHFEAYLRQAVGLPSSPPAGVPDWTRLMLGPFAPTFWTGNPAAPATGPGESAAPPSDGEKALRQEVEALRVQVDALRATIADDKA